MVKLKGATIMESLVAMILIMVCFGIGTMVFVNVLNNDKSRLRLKAILLLKEESNNLKAAQLYFDSERKEGGWIISWEFEKYNEVDNLLHMKLKVIDEKGNLVAEQDELVVESENSTDETVYSFICTDDSNQELSNLNFF